MSEPKLEQIEAYWETRLKTITVANGYYTAPVTVSRRMPSAAELTDTKLPGLFATVTQIVLDPAYIGQAKKSMKLSATLATYLIANDAPQTGTIIARLKTDVIRCLLLEFTFGGLLHRAPTNINWQSDLEGKYLPRVVAQLNFTVMYLEDLT